MSKHYEAAITARINELCIKLDCGFITKLKKEEIFVKLNKLIKQRDNLRKIMGDGNEEDRTETTD